MSFMKLQSTNDEVNENNTKMDDTQKNTLKRKYQSNTIYSLITRCKRHTIGYYVRTYKIEKKKHIIQ